MFVNFVLFCILLEVRYDMMDILIAVEENREDEVLIHVKFLFCIAQMLMVHFFSFLFPLFCWGVLMESKRWSDTTTMNPFPKVWKKNK